MKSDYLYRRVFRSAQTLARMRPPGCTPLTREVALKAFDTSVFDQRDALLVDERDASLVEFAIASATRIVVCGA
eukprot:1252821-Rhodomonas_salina.3